MSLTIPRPLHFEHMPCSFCSLLGMTLGTLAQTLCITSIQLSSESLSSREPLFLSPFPDNWPGQRSAVSAAA